MSIIKAEDEKKWINAFLVLCSVLLSYVTIQFIEQMGEWFDLEARIANFLMVAQAVGVLTGVVAFVIATKNKAAQSHLEEVYSELTKVVWSDKDTAMKLTVGIVISLTILSLIFVLVDYVSQQSLELIYN